MSMMKIEVVADPSVTTGGHAIIRLRGVALLPPGATFRIEPIDETLADEIGWPVGDIQPIETRQTSDGMEMRVGPSVVDAPMLEPGMPVTISVPDAHLSAELVWPSLPVSSGAAMAPVVLTPSQMAAEFAAAERAKAEAKRAAELAELEAQREKERSELERREAEEAERRDAAVAAAIAAAVQTDASTKPMRDAARELDAVLAMEQPVIVEPKVDAKPNGLALNGTGDPLSTLGSAAARRVTDLDGLSRLKRPQTETSEPSLPATDRDSSLPAIIVKQASEAASARATPSALEPVAAAPMVASPQNRLLPFLAGVATAAACAALLVFASARNGAAWLPAPGKEAAKVSIADAFMAGPQSPRGEIAANIDLPTALRLADYNLHGVDRPIDRAEAEFWLKKSLSLTASHAQLRWALTQLGTLAAQPITGAPDFEKARQLWEISAVNGDPIALCFLGTLSENGLGAAPDRSKALEYYKRAKEIGGCPTSDEAIARLSR
jgi:TPR repeat protein